MKSKRIFIYAIPRDYGKTYYELNKLQQENQSLKKWKELHSCLYLTKENIRLIEENQSLKDRIEKAIKIFKECKLLMPHEFDWEEQFENAIQKLKGDDK